MDNMILSGNRIFTSYYSEQESVVYNFAGNRVKDIQLDNSYFPGKNSFLISTAEHIYNYQIKNDYLQMIHTGRKKVVRYDKVKDRVYILNDSRVEVIDVTLGLTVNSFPLQEEITDFHLFYNR